MTLFTPRSANSDQHCRCNVCDVAYKLGFMEHLLDQRSYHLLGSWDRQREHYVQSLLSCIEVLATCETLRVPLERPGFMYKAA